MGSVPGAMSLEAVFGGTGGGMRAAGKVNAFSGGMNELLETIGRQSQEEPVSDAVNPQPSDAFSGTKTMRVPEEQIRQPQKQAVVVEVTNMASKEKLPTSDICINVWLWLGYSFWMAMAVFVVWRLAR